MFSVFLFGFGMASAAKAQQKMSNPCTSKSRNLELHFTMSVFLLAASLDFQLYWRALPSFPVLANTGSGKLWLAQKLKVHFNGMLVGCVVFFGWVLAWLLLQRLGKR